MSAPCTVRVFGLVTALRDDGTRVSVPFGTYMIEVLPNSRYRLSGQGLPTFELDLADLSTYMGSQLKVVGGPWPCEKS